MAYADTSWATRDPIIASKLQQMSDNDAYLKAEVDAHMPKGVLAITKRINHVVNAFNSTGAVAPSLDISFTITSGRLVKLTHFVRSYSSDQFNTAIGQRIYDNSGNVINERNVFIEPIGVGCAGGAVYAFLQLAAGTYTYRAGGIVYLSDNGNIGNASINCSAQAYAFMMAEDIGANISIPET